MLEKPIILIKNQKKLQKTFSFFLSESQAQTEVVVQQTLMI